NFEVLSSLPISFRDPQCVVHKHELFICGTYLKHYCYSYHTLKNEYRLICRYPYEVILEGYCVVKRINPNNADDITLLCFGGKKFSDKRTLIMQYRSVWDNIDKTYSNEWKPLKNNFNEYVYIGRNEVDYSGARAVIGGSDNHLLFITFFQITWMCLI
ncbi:hypothetical protein RFI_35573, partial [Reticulomyxa filosa]